MKVQFKQFAFVYHYPSFFPEDTPPVSQSNNWASFSHDWNHFVFKGCRSYYFFSTPHCLFKPKTTNPQQVVFVTLTRLADSGRRSCAACRRCNCWRSPAPWRRPECNRRSSLWGWRLPAFWSLQQQSHQWIKERSQWGFIRLWEWI